MPVLSEPDMAADGGVARPLESENAFLLCLAVKTRLPRRGPCRYEMLSSLLRSDCVVDAGLVNEKNRSCQEKAEKAVIAELRRRKEV